jgi:hypothetical protein
MRDFLNAINSISHAEERLKGASRRTLRASAVPPTTWLPPGSSLGIFHAARPSFDSRCRIHGFLSVYPSNRARSGFAVAGISRRPRPRAAPSATAVGGKPLERERPGAKPLSGGAADCCLELSRRRSRSARGWRRMNLG